jgi:hypothetical protein
MIVRVFLCNFTIYKKNIQTNNNINELIGNTMAYILNPTNMDPLKQGFPIEFDSFEGVTPKANEMLGTIGVPDPEVVVSQFDWLNNGEVQLEVADIEKIANSGDDNCPTVGEVINYGDGDNQGDGNDGGNDVNP